MKLKFFSLFLLTCLAAIIIAAFNNKQKQVVCFGDSITYGAQVDGHSWVYFLSQEHPDIDFVNAGRSGRKTSDKEELLPVLKKYPNADDYLIFLGVNDLKNGNDSMVNSCVENMKWMINEIRKVNATAKIVILAPSDINLKTMNEINKKKEYNENTKESLYKLEKKYKELAKEQHLGFISLLHVVSKPNYADGLHPNIEGQKEIANAVWKGLNKIK
ncbi:MAG TPA: SGNH/GDSL hydrolase family protein [Hanamia sp.]|nr:SGNH/GDSL hydrolase family protein [Hanamia sp.]